MDKLVKPESKSQTLKKESTKVQVAFEVKNKIECKICGNWRKTRSENENHLSNSHSEYAISVTKEIDTKGFNKPKQLHRCLGCERNLFFYKTL